MDSLGLYELEELSLFGGEQLLMGLGSPLEPDSPTPFPDVRDYTNRLGSLGLEQSLNKTKVSGTSLEIPSNSSVEGALTGLEYGWMDTRLDLLDLLQESEPDVGSYNNTCPNDDLAMLTDAVPSHTIAQAEPTSIDDLFNQMSRSVGPMEDLEQTATAEQDLLSQVLTRLTDYIDQDDVVPSCMPDLGSGVLSPVSVTDIESLLSESDNLVEVSPNDSGLESLLSSRPESPCSSVQYINVDSDYEPSESSSSRKKRKNSRATPYEKLPRDKKERKKIQNRTAALKYRQKKKDESHVVISEVDQLEDRNKELKGKVESMTREIQYLKDLMADVLKAKGIKA